MRYLSTGGAYVTDLVGAVSRGLAPDGCLYVPEELPRFDPDAIRGETVAGIAAELLAPFFKGSSLAPDLNALCEDTFDFPIPLVPLDNGSGTLSVLEMFHGPTAAFKDVGARFLAAVMERILAGSSAPDSRPLTILVATSGDTGGAVAAAFHTRRGMRVAALFPKGQVSPRQKHQLTCWSDNVRSFEVGGSFDQCQSVLKSALNDPGLNARHRLSAANSINLGRLLPQVVYHAAAGLWHWRTHHNRASFIVPTGNLGNALACIWARAMGMPIGDIILATNANRVLPEFLATGQWQPRSSIRTLASAMDVGNPSNMERLVHLMPDFAELRGSVQAYPVSDTAIRDQIARDHKRRGQVWCPHTATAFRVYDELPQVRRSAEPWIVVATAHPAKFDNIVEDVVGCTVPVPPALAALLKRPSNWEALEPDLAALTKKLNDW